MFKSFEQYLTILQNRDFKMSLKLNLTTSLRKVMCFILKLFQHFDILREISFLMKILKSISILIGLNVFCLNEVILLSSLTLYTFLKMIHHFRSINRHMGENRKIERYIHKMIKKYFQFQVCFQDIYISMAVIFSST